MNAWSTTTNESQSLQKRQSNQQQQSIIKQWIWTQFGIVEYTMDSLATHALDLMFNSTKSTNKSRESTIKSSKHKSKSHKKNSSNKQDKDSGEHNIRRMKTYNWPSGPSNCDEANERITGIG
eukprot:614353_1